MNAVRADALPSFGQKARSGPSAKSPQHDRRQKVASRRLLASVPKGQQQSLHRCSPSCLVGLTWIVQSCQLIVRTDNQIEPSFDHAIASLRYREPVPHHVRSLMPSRNVRQAAPNATSGPGPAGAGSALVRLRSPRFDENLAKFWQRTRFWGHFTGYISREQRIMSPLL
jgi:hypothetical protein